MAKKKKPRAKPTKLAAPGKTAGESLFLQVLDAGEGILRLAPTWVPRSFLMPGRRIKLAPQDLYALGAHRGGIDERWFSSTTAAANEGAPYRACRFVQNRFVVAHRRPPRMQV